MNFNQSMNPAFDFEHMNLIPRKCIVKSRAECDTSVQFGPRRFKVPVVPANMECVIDLDIAVKLADAGYFYILHRFGIDIPKFAHYMRKRGSIVSISIGVTEEVYDLLKQLRDADLMPDYVTIDIAHGHSIRMEAMLKFIQTLPKRPFVIAGNVSTAEAAVDLESWGADAIKVGIGPGSACTTYVATGFGSRGMQAKAVYDAALAVKQALIIADGGIKEPGDIAKAVALGATMVMVGGMFSGLVDSPGAIVSVGDQRYKEFWGSASAAQGKTNRIEGTKKLIPLKDRAYLEEMTHITECLQSAISYAGGHSLDTLLEVKIQLKLSA